MATPVPEDDLPEDLKPVAKAKKLTPVPEDDLPEDLKVVAKAAPKKAPAIAPEPKTTLAPLEKLGKEVTSPGFLTAAAPAVGRALGGLPGELAGMGLGMLAAGKKPELPAAPAAPAVQAAPVAAAKPEPEEPTALAPSFMKGKKLGEFLKEKGGADLGKPISMPEVPEEEQQTEGLWRKAGRAVLPKVIEEPILGKEPLLGGKVRWAGPVGLGERLTGAFEKVPLAVFGETKAGRFFEEPAEEPGKTPPKNAFERMLWEESKKKKERAIARRKAAGVPLTSEKLPWFSGEEFVKAQTPAFEQTKKEMREEQARSALTAPIAIPVAAVKDLTGLLAGVTEMFTEALGPAVVPEGDPQVVEARRLLGEARKTGDKAKIEKAESNLDSAEQLAIGGKLGGGLGQIPGQTLALTEGLTDPSLKNALLTKPFSTYVMLFQPAKGVAGKIAARTPRLAAITAPADAAVKATAQKVADAVVPKAVGKARDVVTQYIADSVHSGNRMVAGILDDLTTNKAGSLTALKEWLQRQINDGKVRLAEEELRPLEVWMRPEEKAREVEAATRKAETARTQAEKQASLREMSKATAEKAVLQERALRELTKQADKVQADIAKATTQAETTQLQAKLAELENKQRVLQSRLKAEGVESRFRGRAQKVAQEASEAGIDLATEAGKKMADKAIMRKMAETERLQREAEARRETGLSEEEALRQQGEQTQERLREQERARAGVAATKGVELAEAAKALTEEGAPTALTEEARRAAAKQGPIAAGAERAAKRAEERVAEVEARPLVKAGTIYVPEKALPKEKFTIEQAYEEARSAQEEAKRNPTLENMRKGWQAARDIQTLDEAQKGEVRVSDYRNAADRALRDATEAQQRVLESNENLADMERRAQSPRTTITAEDLEKARLENQQARISAEDATNRVDQAQRAYELVRDTQLPKKVPEYTTETGIAAGAPIAEALYRMPEGRLQIISDLVDEASTLKKQAVEAGANLEDMPVSPEMARKIGVPEGTSLYDATRRLAAHLSSRNIDVPSYIAEFLRSQGIERGAEEAGRWMDAEIKAENATRMIEWEFGNVRRPVATEEVGTLERGGKVVKRARAMEEEFARAKTEGADKQAAGVERVLQKELDQMGEVLSREETPKSIRTNNAEFDRALDEYSRELIRLGFDLPEPSFDQDAKTFLSSIDYQGRKILTPERVKQRLLEVLGSDTMQPALHSPELRQALLKKAKARLQEMNDAFRQAGELSKVIDINRALAEVRKYLVDQKNLSFQSKNRFPGYVYDGATILSREDFASAFDEVNPKAANMARAKAFDYIANQQAGAANVYAMLHGIYSEMNRFRFTPEGEWKRNSETGKVPSDAATFAIQMAEDVLAGKEAAPVFMPYEGSIVAEMLRKEAEQARWTPEQKAKLLDLANQVGDMVSGEELEGPLNDVYRNVYEGTDAKAPDVKNLHMTRDALRAMKSHLQAVTDISQLNVVADLLQRISQVTKKNVVALNLRALDNNNLSNSLLQVVTRATGSFLPGLFIESYKMNKFLSGDRQGFSQPELNMYNALSKRKILFRTEFRKMYGETAAWSRMKEVFGSVAAAEAALETNINAFVKVPEKYNAIRDFMAESYNKYGDAPFRLEEMTHQYQDVYSKLDVQEPGETTKLHANKYKLLDAKRLNDGMFEIVDPTGRTAKQTIALDSPKMADLIAAHADVMQEAKFLNPERMGIWFKALQSKGLQPLTGIFSWFVGALDIPFFKEGLGYEMMKGPAALETTSPAIKKLQADQYTSWAFKRAMLFGASQAAFLDQRKVEDVRKSLGSNSALASVMVAPTSNPAYLLMRDTAPVLFIGPTVAAANAVNHIISWINFSARSPLTSPEYLTQVMNSDQDWANWTPERLQQLKQANPSLGEYGEKMHALAKEDPKAYRDRALVKRDMQRFINEGINSGEDVLRLTGLSGSPMLRWGIDVIQGGLSGENAVRQFGTMVLGATPWSAVDIASTMLKQAGAEPFGVLSSYGLTMAKRGEQEDASSMSEWAFSQLFGLGWKKVFYGTGGEKPGDVRGYPRMLGYLNNFEKVIDESILKPARREARTALLMAGREGATEEDKAKAKTAQQVLKMFEDGAKSFVTKQKRAIMEQQRMMRGDNTQ